MFQGIVTNERLSEILIDEIEELRQYIEAKRKPLTEEEIDAIALKLWDSIFLIPDGFHQCSRAIERAHGIGGEV
jgi:hypothetical protein